MRNSFSAARNSIERSVPCESSHTLRGLRATPCGSAPLQNSSASLKACDLGTGERPRAFSGENETTTQGGLSLAKPRRISPVVPKPSFHRSGSGLHDSSRVSMTEGEAPNGLLACGQPVICSGNANLVRNDPSQSPAAARIALLPVDSVWHGMLCVTHSSATVPHPSGYSGGLRFPKVRPGSSPDSTKHSRALSKLVIGCVSNYGMVDKRNAAVVRYNGLHFFEDISRCALLGLDDLPCLRGTLRLKRSKRSHLFRVPAASWEQLYVSLEGCQLSWFKNERIFMTHGNAAAMGSVSLILCRGRVDVVGDEGQFVVKLGRASAGDVKESMLLFDAPEGEPHDRGAWMLYILSCINKGRECRQRLHDVRWDTVESEVMQLGCAAGWRARPTRYIDHKPLPC